MLYCGIVAAGPYVQLATLAEVRTDEPPIRLHATFYEPGSAAQVGLQLRHLGEVAVGVGLALGEGRRADQELRRRGVNPLPPTDAGQRLLASAGLAPYAGGGGGDVVEEGAYATTPAFETHPDGVFYALRGVKLPAKRHPLGIELRIEELQDEHVEDEDDLWHRRIEELEAAAVALAAHRYAIGHACWVGDPAEGVVVLPGSRLPDVFSGEGVIPPVPRTPLPPHE
jgi:predicted nuclease with RNAse H fold